ncbi:MULTISPECIES: helix-turn-helix domain-containing protein [Saccharothrix]|uniref:helix-turn-helix domain-containing protein n=1 Tax=Saccharothrix TaxID=2071 RepID=UPI000939FC44
MSRPDLDNPRLLHTPAEAAALLAVRESWLRRKAGRREIPCTFLGKHLRFSPDDLTSIAQAGARPARSTRPPARRHRSFRD